MRKFLIVFLMSLAGMAAFVASPLRACDLQVESAWIRAAPPNAPTLAGYAVLKNTGTKSLRIEAIESPTFAAIELHESVIANGIASMRTMDKLTITAGDKVELSPNGKHFMLTGAKQALKKGDAVVVRLKDSMGCITAAIFTVSHGDALDKAEMQHSMPMGK